MVVAQVQPPEMADTTRFLEEVSARTAGVSRLEMCIQCGTCGGSCPSADDMDKVKSRLLRSAQRRSEEAEAWFMHMYQLMAMPVSALIISLT